MLKGSALISSEEMFLIYMFINVVKMFLLTGEEKNYIFQPLLNILDKMVSKKQLSYQVVHDFTSELYRLCIQAKVLVYQQSFVIASALTAEQEFLNRCGDYPNSRVSKDEFLSHSKVLDKKLYTKGIQVFESTEEFIKDLKDFQPLILNGCWQICDHNHYYCIPVCEAGTLTMKCPECTLSATGMKIASSWP